METTKKPYETPEIEVIELETTPSLLGESPYRYQYEIE